MARNRGIIQLQGTIGGMTFRRDGTVSQAQGSRPVTSQRTRENNQEFGTAARQGKVIRDAVSPLSVGDPFLPSRLLKVVRSGIALDPTNERGKRILSKAEAIQVLPGFELSGRMNLASIAPLNVLIQGDQLRVEKYGGGDLLPSDFYQPEGTTDIQLMALVSVVDLRPEVLRVMDINVFQSELGGELVLPEVALVVDPDPELVTLAAVSVRFYQMVNGAYYRLSDGSHDVGRIVAVI